MGIGNRKVRLFIASSLDGYIATKEKSLDWLEQVEGKGDNGYSQFYETVDTVILGKKTFDWLISQRLSEWPYAEKQCYVYTHQQLQDMQDIHFTKEPVASLIHTLRQQPGQDIWIVGGGELIYSFLEQHLIDEVIVTMEPILLGEGIPLFKPGFSTVELTLQQTKTYGQFVELHYIVKKYKKKSAIKCAQTK